MVPSVGKGYDELPVGLEKRKALYPPLEFISLLPSANIRFVEKDKKRRTKEKTQQ